MFHFFVFPLSLSPSLLRLSECLFITSGSFTCLIDTDLHNAEIHTNIFMARKKENSFNPTVDPYTLCDLAVSRATSLSFDITEQL